MGKLGRQRKSDDEVKMHVSFYGGLCVDPGELLRSKAAQDNIKKMCEVFGTQPPLDASESSSRSKPSLDTSHQKDSGDSG